MNKTVFAFVVQLVFSCSTMGSEIPWSQLLIEPTESNFIAAKKQLSHTHKCSGDWYAKPEYSSQLRSLFGMVREGNEYAFEVNTLIIDCLDGGSLGDSFRAIGSFFDQNPLEFFKIIAEKKLPNTTLKYMLVMLPLNTVDNTQKKFHLLQRRLKMTVEVKNDIDPDLQDRAISILTTEIGVMKSLIRKTTVTPNHKKTP